MLKNYYHFGFGITFLIALINIPIAFGQEDVEDTLKIDTILKQGVETYYVFPKQTPLTLTGEQEMCPSNNCKMIFDKSIEDFGSDGISLSLVPENNTMNVFGYLKLKGGADKGVLDIGFECDISNIEKNAKLGTTKYVCSDASGWFIPEDIDKQYNYDYSASFELPSRHFILNGTSTGVLRGTGSGHDCILFDC